MTSSKIIKKYEDKIKNVYRMIDSGESDLIIAKRENDQNKIDRIESNMRPLRASKYLLEEVIKDMRTLSN